MKFKKKPGYIKKYPLKKKSSIIDSDMTYFLFNFGIWDIHNLRAIRKLNKIGIFNYKINKLF